MRINDSDVHLCIKRFYVKGFLTAVISPLAVS